MRAQILKVNKAERTLAAKNAAKHFASSATFINANNIGCYFAKGKEFDTQPLIALIWESAKNCYLPIITAESKKLNFILYTPTTPLKENKFGILEPTNNEDSIPTQNLDVVLLPLLGFDLKGIRLGTGGGYYDCTFDFLKKSNHQKPILIGVAYDWQQRNLVADQWDVPLQGILTESQFCLF